MASKQTRRSISVRGTTYAHLRDFCAANDRSMSDVVEELLSKILENGAAPPAKKTVAPLVARAPHKPEPKVMKPVEDRAAVRVTPLPRPEPEKVVEKAVEKPAPIKLAPRTETPKRPELNRPVPVANAGRPAPTPAEKVKGTARSTNDYRAIRF
jgi:hypothetical protein